MLAEHIDLHNEEAATRIAETIRLNDLDELGLRGDDVAQAASKISVFPSVRAALFALQRNFALSPPAGYQGAVLDGRDIGTRICPDADFKFYVTADPEVRAKRRFKELQERGIKSIYNEVLKDMVLRDQRDQQRREWPLQAAQDAVIIDTTHRTAEEAFHFAVNYINGCLGSREQSPGKQDG
jgi:cytidylate kinase